MTRTLADTRRALLSVILLHLVARRSAVLDRIDAQGWRWDPEASRELTAVDEALTRIGYFDSLTRPSGRS